MAGDEIESEGGSEPSAESGSRAPGPPEPGQAPPPPGLPGYPPPLGPGAPYGYPPPPYGPQGGGWPPPPYGPPPGYPPSGPPPGYPPPGYPPPYGMPPGGPPGYGAPPGWSPQPPAMGPAAWMPWLPRLPGSGRFRAQTIGEMLDSAFSIYRRHFLPMALAVAVVAIPFTVLELVLFHQPALSPFLSLAASGASASSANLTPSDVQDLLVAELVILGASLFYSLLLLPQAQALVTRIAAASYRGTGVDTRGESRTVLRRAPMLVVAELLALLLIAAVPFVAVLLLFASQSVELMPLLMILAVVAALFAGVRLALLVPVVAFEGLGPAPSVRRAWSLTRGVWWRTLGVLLLVGLISFVISLILEEGAALLMSGLSPIDRLSADTAVGGIVGVLVAPVQFIAVMLLYFDIRIRREAYDLELLAETL